MTNEWGGTIKDKTSGQVSANTMRPQVCIKYTYKGVGVMIEEREYDEAGNWSRKNENICNGDEIIVSVREDRPRAEGGRKTVTTYYNSDGIKVSGYGYEEDARGSCLKKIMYVYNEAGILYREKEISDSGERETCYHEDESRSRVMEFEGGACIKITEFDTDGKRIKVTDGEGKEITE